MRRRRGVIFGALVSAEMERRGLSQRLSHRPDNRVASRPRHAASEVPWDQSSVSRCPWRLNDQNVAETASSTADPLAAGSAVELSIPVEMSVAPRLLAAAQVHLLDDCCCRQRTLSDLRHGCGGGELKIIADCSSPSWKSWRPNSCTTPRTGGLGIGGTWRVLVSAW